DRGAQGRQEGRGVRRGEAEGAAAGQGEEIRGSGRGEAGWRIRRAAVPPATAATPTRKTWASRSLAARPSPPARSWSASAARTSAPGRARPRVATTPS